MSNKLDEKIPEHWYAILAILLMRLDKTHVRISAKDVSSVGKNKKLVMQEKPDGLHIYFVTQKQYEAMLRHNTQVN